MQFRASAWGGASDAARVLRTLWSVWFLMPHRPEIFDGTRPRTRPGRVTELFSWITGPAAVSAVGTEHLPPTSSSLFRALIRLLDLDDKHDSDMLPLMPLTSHVLLQIAGESYVEPRSWEIASVEEVQDRPSET